VCWSTDHVDVWLAVGWAVRVRTADLIPSTRRGRTLPRTLQRPNCSAGTLGDLAHCASCSPLSHTYNCERRPRAWEGGTRPWHYPADVRQFCRPDGPASTSQRGSATVRDLPPQRPGRQSLCQPNLVNRAGVCRKARRPAPRARRRWCRGVWFGPPPPLGQLDLVLLHLNPTPIQIPLQTKPSR